LSLVAEYLALRLNGGVAEVTSGGGVPRDRFFRSAQAGSGGLFMLLQDLHPEVSLDGHMLNVDKPRYPDACYEGSHMTLVPSVFIWPHLALDHTESAFELTYAARGVAKVWAGLAAETESQPLGALLGTSRLAILGLLAVPLSTTQIAHTLGLSPAAVSRHLSILRGSGMVVSWRSGRSILYRRTGLADTLIGSQRATERAGARGPDTAMPGNVRRLGTAAHRDAATGT
jgi:DNA-binding transcriptional ArsR family regulator